MSSEDTLLDQLIKEDEARLLANNRFGGLTTEERKRQVYRHSTIPLPSGRAEGPIRSNYLHLSNFELDGIPQVEEMEDHLVREYELVKASEKVRRAVEELGYRGTSSAAPHANTSPTALQWHKQNEAERYRRDLYESTLVRPPQVQRTTLETSGSAPPPAIDRSQTISNSRLVSPYLTLHSVGRYTRYEALQQRYPIHHSDTSPTARQPAAPSSRC